MDGPLLPVKHLLSRGTNIPGLVEVFDTSTINLLTLSDKEKMVIISLKEVEEFYQKEILDGKRTREVQALGNTYLDKLIILRDHVISLLQCDPKYISIQQRIESGSISYEEGVDELLTLLLGKPISIQLFIKSLNLGLQFNKEQKFSGSVLNKRQSVRQTTDSFSDISTQQKIDKEVLPPDIREGGLGTGTYEEDIRVGNNFDRGGLLLDLLEDIEVDLETVVVTTGISGSRKQNYCVLYIPSLEKTVFVNNLYGQATFIVNGHVSDEEMNYTKKQLMYKKYAKKIEFTEGKELERTSIVSACLKNDSNSVLTTDTSGGNTIKIAHNELVFDIDIGGVVMTVVRLSGKGIRQEYTGDAQHYASLFKTRANGKEGYYPNLCKPPHGKYIPVCTPKLLDEFVKLYALKKKSEDTRLVLKGKENMVILPIDGTQVSCVRVSQTGIWTRYVGEWQQNSAAFAARANGKMGYYPDLCKGQTGHTSIPVCTYSLFEAYIQEVGLQKRDEDGKEIIEHDDIYFELDIQGTPTQVIRATYTGIWSLYVNKQKVFDDFNKRVIGKVGYYPNLCKTKNGVSIPVCTEALFDEFVAYRERIGKKLVLKQQ